MNDIDKPIEEREATKISSRLMEKQISTEDRLFAIEEAIKNIIAEFGDIPTPKFNDIQQKVSEN